MNAISAVGLDARLLVGADMHAHAAAAAADLAHSAEPIQLHTYAPSSPRVDATAASAHRLYSSPERPCHLKDAATSSKVPSAPYSKPGYALQAHADAADQVFSQAAARRPPKQSFAAIVPSVGLLGATVAQGPADVTTDQDLYLHFLHSQHWQQDDDNDDDASPVDYAVDEGEADPDAVDANTNAGGFDGWIGQIEHQSVPARLPTRNAFYRSLRFKHGHSDVGDSDGSDSNDARDNGDTGAASMLASKTVWCAAIDQSSAYTSSVLNDAYASHLVTAPPEPELKLVLSMTRLANSCRSL